jgi:hypothetical protein
VTFAAAIVLLAAQKCPAVDAETNQESFATSWDCCISILEHYKEQIRSASPAIRVLQTLRSQLIASQGQREYSHLTPRVTVLLFSTYYLLEGASNPAINDDGNSSATIAHATAAFEIPSDIDIQQDWNEFNSNMTDTISDAWFSQHLVNLDWLDIS